jgi:hypothetical protein
MWGITVRSEVSVLIHPTGVLLDSGQDSGVASLFLEPYCPQTNPSQTLLYDREHCHADIDNRHRRAGILPIDSRQLVRMSLHLSSFRFPCNITRGPSPFHEKHTHIIMQPPPDFTVGITHAGRYRSSGIRHTQTLPSDHHII